MVYHEEFLACLFHLQSTPFLLTVSFPERILFCNQLRLHCCPVAIDDVRVDRLGEELAVDSGVWLTYVNTAAMHDAEMVDGWNKSLDVILIFVS